MQISSPNISMKSRQTGVATLPISLILLILLTLITVYAARVGLLETRTSANKQRAEQALSAAEFAIEQGIAFVKTNEKRIFATTGTDGWSSTANTSAIKWSTCPAAATLTDPAEYIPSCAELPDAERQTWLVVRNIPTINLTTCTDSKVNGTTDKAHAYPDGLCDDDSGFSNVSGDYKTPSGTRALHLMTKCRDDDANGTCDSPLRPYDYPVIRIEATGRSADQSGIARVEQSVFFFDLFPGKTNTPAPLMAAGLASGGGNFNVVVNPDADKDQAFEQPLGLWTGGNVTVSGSSSTCYLGDVNINGFLGDAKNGKATEPATYYKLDTSVSPPAPSSTQNTLTLCRTCTCPSSSEAAKDKTSGAITNTTTWPAEEDILDVDSHGTVNSHNNKWLDTAFPDDVFQFVFGIPQSRYQIVKDAAQKISCDALVTLGTHAHGLYWIEGDCTINGGADIGWFGPTSNVSTNAGYSDGPVIVVVEGDVAITGTSQFVGLLFAFSPTNTQLAVDLNGGPTFYGALISNTTLDLKGTYRARYEEIVFENFTSGNIVRGFGKLPGSWKDYSL